MQESDHKGADQVAVRKVKCTAISVFVLAILGFLCAYVAHLQLNRHQEMDSWARRQQDRITVIPGERGTLSDRNGVILNKSVPAYSLALRIEAIRDPRDTQRRTLERVSEIVSDLASFLGPEYYRTRPGREAAREHIRKNTPLPFVLWRNLDRDAIDRWALEKAQFPGTELVMSWARHYELPNCAYHVRGFTALGQPVYMPEFRLYNLTYLELIGRSGLEEALNPVLSGYGGFEQLRTDVLLYRQDVLEAKAAVRGEDFRTTLDIRLQQHLEEHFRSHGYSGALVIMDLRNSQILASVSEPSASFAGNSKGEGTQVNRVLAGYYPPGSTLKPLVALAALQNGLVTTEEQIVCHGAYVLSDGRQIACTAKYGHGPLDLESAIARSCNEYFCELGVRLGVEHLDEVGREFGLGTQPFTELRHQEIDGIRFSPAWAREKRVKNRGWSEGDSANAGIGQGGWIVTPMQLLIALTALVTDKQYRPTFVLSEFRQDPEPIGLDETMRNAIMNGMRGCVEYGTGRSMRVPGYIVYAKTGTAQSGSSKGSHALSYAALYNDEGPLLACACVIEHGGSGGRVAGPVVREALQSALQYLDRSEAEE